MLLSVSEFRSSSADSLLAAPPWPVQTPALGLIPLQREVVDTAGRDTVAAGVGSYFP